MKLYYWRFIFKHDVTGERVHVDTHGCNYDHAALNCAGIFERATGKNFDCYLFVLSGELDKSLIKKTMLKA